MYLCTNCCSIYEKTKQYPDGSFTMLNLNKPQKCCKHCCHFHRYVLVDNADLKRVLHYVFLDYIIEIDEQDEMFIELLYL